MKLEGWPSRIRTAIAVVALALAMPPGAAFAQSPGIGVVAFDIPAGPLAGALRQFGDRTGAPVHADPGLVAGKASPGVRGSLAARDALTALLAGTGLRADAAGAGWILVAATGNDVQLPAVTVRATPERADGPVDGYVARRSGSGLKTDTPLIETPQAITVIGAEQIAEQGANTVQEALRYVAGLRSDAYGVDSRGDWFFIRGTEALTFLDGLRTDFDYYNNTRIDPFALERVEVVKGPSSVLYGQGNVGGLVNMVSKRPPETFGGSVEAQVGSHKWLQVAADVGGPLTADGTWLYRLIAVGRNAETQVDYVDNDRILVAPSLTWRPRPGTEWTFLANLQRDRSGQVTNFLPWSGTALDNPNGRIPTSRLVSEPSFDAYDTDQASIGWQFSHAIDDTWTVAQNLRYRESKATYRALYPDVYTDPQDPFVDPEQRSVYRYVYENDPKARAFVVDTRAQARFATGAVRHLAIAGVDYTWSRVTGRSGFGFDDRPFDLFSPVYLGIEAPELADNPELELKQLGFYAQDQMNFAGRWHAVLGIRHDEAETRSEGSDAVKDHATTWRAGLLYDLDDGLAPYASYTESFLPVGYADFYGQPYQAQRGKQYEVGLKYQPPGRNLLATVALYKLREDNHLSYDPENPFNQIQRGRIDVKGVELELNAQLSSAFDLIATYTYTDGEQKDDTTGETLAIAGLPKNMASAWGVYRFALGELKGFSAGAGLRYVGGTTDETRTIRLPGETLVDLMVAWEQGRWRAAVNASNVGDRTYVATCLARGDCFYGNRRVVTGTLAYRF